MHTMCYLVQDHRVRLLPHALPFYHCTFGDVLNQAISFCGLMASLCYNNSTKLILPFYQAKQVSWLLPASSHSNSSSALPLEHIIVHESDIEK